MSPSINSQGSNADGYEDRQFVVLTSEKQARVVALPSQNCVYKQQLADTHLVIKAEITSLKGMLTAIFCNKVKNEKLSMWRQARSDCILTHSTVSSIRPTLWISILELISFFCVSQKATIMVKYDCFELTDSVCLVCYVSNGHVCTYSLPSLRPLIDVDFVPVSDLR